jgi:Uma2 family endonuclease
LIVPFFDACEHSFPAAHRRELQALAGDRAAVNAPFVVYLDEINVFQPDILIVLNERLGILTEEGAEGAPELVVEILSPKTRRLDLVNKKLEYARAGVKEHWVIEPEPRSLTIHELTSDGVEKIRQLGRRGQPLDGSAARIRRCRGNDLREMSGNVWHR